MDETQGQGQYITQTEAYMNTYFNWQTNIRK